MDLAYCTHCGAAYLHAEKQCPHCKTDSPERASRTGQGIVTAMLLGLSLIGCQQEEEVIDENPSPTKMETQDAEQSTKAEVSSPAEEKPSESTESIEEKPTDPEEKPEEVVQKEPAEKKDDSEKKKDPAATKISGMGGMGMHRPSASVAPKYGAPAMSIPQNSGKVTLQKIQLLEGDCATGINKNIRRYLSQIRAVYSEQLRTDPKLAGRINVALTIEKGQVVAISVDTNSTNNPVFASNITKRMKRWRFASDCTTEAMVPFIFRAQ